MSQEPESLLEVDRLEEVLEEAGPPQPVVVVEYRNKTVPWLAIVGLVVVVMVGSLFVYHFREVERLRAQAREARGELRLLLASNLADEGQTKPAVVSPPATAGSAPHPPDAAVVQPVVVSAGPGSSPAPPTPAAPVAANLVEPAKADPAMALAQLPEKSEPAPRPEPGPTAPTASIPPSPDRSTVPPASDILASRGPDFVSPFDEGAATGGKGRAGAPAIDPAPGTVPEAARPPDSDLPPAGSTMPIAAAAPVAVPAEPPLPSKEETERQIREEAAGKRAEAGRRLAQQEQDLRTIRDDDRSRFREELRTILREYGYGKQAAKQIEELSVHASRDDDPIKRRLASRVIESRSNSLSTKVRQLREIGVPEAVILDFLANGLHHNLGARGGPQSSSDVWVQASRLLLACELTPPRQGTSTSAGRAADPGARRPSASSLLRRYRQAGVTSRTP